MLFIDEIEITPIKSILSSEISIFRVKFAHV